MRIITISKRGNTRKVQVYHIVAGVEVNWSSEAAKVWGLRFDNRTRAVLVRGNFGDDVLIGLLVKTDTD
jgi:hypothetical protein